MNKRIRSMIDAIFCEMKMTAENLALRDELMANAQARYEDMIAQGKTEEEAFVQVAASLEDVQSLLAEMNPEDTPVQPESKPGESAAPLDEQPEDGASDAQTNNAQENPQGNVDLGDALNKAFTALGSWGQSIMPQAKKLARQMDDATGGMLRDLGRAVNKGMQDAQKAAGDVLDRYQQEKYTVTTEKTPEEMREDAKDLRAQANLKRAVNDETSAAALDAQAETLETQAEALEQASAMEQASKDADEAARPEQEDSPFSAVLDDEASPEQEAQPQRPIYGADGELDEDAFAKSVDQMSREAERLVRETGEKLSDLGRQAGEAADKAGEALNDVVFGKRNPQQSEVRFPVAGLRKIDVKLDADDVSIEPTDGDELIVRWSVKNGENVPEVSMRSHTLTVRRKNPDVFKTFFSVFSKDGGQITLLVPRGYAADYTLSTTSGDVRLSGVDVDDANVTTTSGDVRIEPDTSVRARDLSVETVSGDVTISAMAANISGESVSGDVFISCDASSVKGGVVSGTLHIEGAFDHLDTDAVSGETKLICTVVPTGKIKADSLSGDVTLFLPGSIRGFVVDFDSMSGRLVNEFGPDRFGTCSLPIEVDTVSGSLTITRL